MEQYIWPGGRICSNCALARKRSAQSASTAWIFTGGDGKLEGCSAMLEMGELRGGGEGAMSQGQGVLYYFWYRKDMAFSVFNEKTKHRLVMRASRLCWPAVIKAGVSGGP